jgi:hypothetical protein
MELEEEQSMTGYWRNLVRDRLYGNANEIKVRPI